MTRRPAIVGCVLLALLAVGSARAQTEGDPDLLIPPPETQPAVRTQPATAPAEMAEDEPPPPADPNAHIPREPLSRLAYALGQLPSYFGPVGVASVAAWAIVVLAWLLFALSRYRTIAWWSAVGVAIVAVILAEMNSAAVSEIRTDRTVELELARQRQLQAEETQRPQTPPASLTGDIRILPDEPTPEQPEPDAVPAYRQRGKQAREADSIRTDAPAARLADAAEQAVAQAEPQFRTLPEGDVLLANRLDRVNLGIVEWVLIGAAALAMLDWLLRFNRTFWPYAPLPVGGRVMDRLVPKKHTAWLAADHAAPVARYIRCALARGENVICFADADPTGEDRPGRLPLGLARVPKTVLSGDAEPYDSEFVFESAWFGRSWFVHVGAAGADKLLREFVTDLRIRRLPKAHAFRTLHLVWAGNQSIPPDALAELLKLCPQTNCKLLVVRPDAPAHAGRFAEHWTRKPNGRIARTTR